ncbi:hypothetical protein Gorai_000540 [Gossypium raimondii]|uniref:Uncharacterized protein n=1 Tax=Gossypium raimondii TaxID=29730 RepID=A0A7J8PDX4_GOSRA|nr:hypothetical protein [Gossypium raimondii]
MAPTCGYYNSQFGQIMILFRFYAEVDITRVHYVLIGYYSEDLTRQFGNFHGTFLAFDSTNFTSGSHHSLRVRVKMDVRLPLRQKKCLVLSSQQMDISLCAQPRYRQPQPSACLCLAPEERGLSLGWGSSVHGPHLSHVSTLTFVQEVSNNLGLTLDKSQPKGILVGSTDVDDQCLDLTQTPSTFDTAGSAT